MSNGKHKLSLPQAQPLPPPDEATEHDDAIVKALSITKKLREDLEMWRDKAEGNRADLDQLRTTVEFLRRDKERLEHIVTRLTEQSVEAEVKLVDMETFINSILQQITDQANLSANSMIAAANNAANMSKGFFDELHARRKKNRPPAAPVMTKQDEANMIALAQKLAPPKADSAVN